MSIFLFFATALVFYIFGLIHMAIISSEEYEKITTDAYRAGYESGKKDEYERIGRLLDKYTEDLERGNRRDSEGVSVANNLS